MNYSRARQSQNYFHNTGKSRLFMPNVFVPIIRVNIYIGETRKEEREQRAKVVLGS